MSVPRVNTPSLICIGCVDGKLRTGTKVEAIRKDTTSSIIVCRLHVENGSGKLGRTGDGLVGCVESPNDLRRRRELVGRVCCQRESSEVGGCSRANTNIAS